MKILNSNPKSWGRKINFVDAANVVVGFDYEQSCCEDFGYLLTRELPKSTQDAEVPEAELEPYFFDTEYQTSDALPDSDGGGSVTFRLTAEGLPDVYLTLYNHHNGYYSHGFEMTKDGKEVAGGSL